MSCYGCDPWGANLHRSCFICEVKGTSAPSGVTFTLPTNTALTATQDNVASVAMDSSRTGTSPESPYIDILADILSVLHGRGDQVDETPMMHLAVLAIEYELADRYLMEEERDRVEHTY